MRFVDSSAHATVAVLTCLLWVNIDAKAQSSESATAAAPNPAASASKPKVPPPISANTVVVSLAPLWNQLSVAQQQSLLPLATSWDSLSDGHKRKWIALAKNYPALAPPEQTKLHSRMAEWAALNPRDRELARLNFAETKKIPITDRAANWEAYKALSPEERRELAKRAATKPKGAAATIKPVDSGKLTPVPVTRHSNELARQVQASKGAIDRRTLLPIAIRPLSAASAPTN
jgi:hypothetical protein